LQREVGGSIPPASISPVSRSIAGHRDHGRLRADYDRRVTAREVAYLRRAKDLVDRAYAQPLDVAALARQAHVSPGHFSRRFREAIPIVTVRVLDQDRALAFYTQTLGFTVTEDMDLGHMRWLTVSPPGQPDLNVLLEKPGPPFVDAETAEQLATLIAKGVGGTLFLQVDDCRATFDDLVAKGVEVIQEPMERFYGIDAAFRDDSGNHVRMTQRAETGIAAPAE
jgi:predicted enzyme related to lactoylglutathione lyase